MVTLVYCKSGVNSNLLHICFRPEMREHFRLENKINIIRISSINEMRFIKTIFKNDDHI